jgi:MoaA/NifB/PqqE/SkfB family radical SAM enzyme
MYAISMDILNKCARKNGIPFSGMFELTAKCNLHCRFCYVCDREKKSDCSPEKSTKEWLDMIRQAADAGMLKCTFTGGDPFIRDDFEEIYCKAYDMGLRISIFTNSVLIGEHQRAFLSRRIPDIISVSLYGASEEAYRIVCGDGGNYRRVIASLDGLRSAGLAFELKVLAMRPLVSEYEAMGRIAALYQCPGRINAFMSPGRDDPDRIMQDWRLPPAQIKEIIESFKRQLPPENDLTAEEMASIRFNSGKEAFLCGAGKDGFIITYDGRMLGCPSLTCFSSFPFKDGFDSAWSSLQQMIEHAESCMECNSCPESEKCYICPADRLSETGSITCCSEYLADMVRSLSLHSKEEIY